MTDRLQVYRGENAVGTFLSDIQQEEEKIREALAAPRPIEMTWKDWENFKKAADCHICNKSLIKDEFLDSLPVWNIEEAGEEGSEKWSYWGQGQTANKPQDGQNTGCISQPEGLRRAPFNASDVAAAERSELHREQHGEIHHTFTWRPALHRQLELFARKP